MIKVVFHGDLRQFGKEFNLYANSPAEALKALLVQIDGLRNYINSGKYRVKFNKDILDEETVKEKFHHFGSGDLHLTPVTTGAGKFTQIIVGAVLIAASWYIGGAAGWAYLGTSSLASGMFMMGASLVLGGIAQLLTKPPSLSNGNEEKSSRNTYFSNLQNSGADGQPVPLAYGRVRCGSRVISQGYQTRRVDTQHDPVMKDPDMGVNLNIVKTYQTPVAALAPNGEPYNIDLEDDSVLNANYTVSVGVN